MRAHKLVVGTLVATGIVGAIACSRTIMPASPDLEAKPEVVDGLLKIVRGFGS